MCDHCGCTLTPTHAHQHDGHHHHDHDHEQEERPPDPGRRVDVLQSILSQNERLAERNRGMFMAHHVATLNMMSSPGSGKTSLIESTLKGKGGHQRIGVVVGDLATENDARRIRDCGAPAVQVTTGTACHLDAHMVHHALDEMELDALDILLIENVGNLVCPASFDLGEQARAVLIAVTEGEDKPLKYPVIFQRADVVVVNKIDLAAAVNYDRETALENIRKVAPGARIIELSARTGEGMEAWMTWLNALHAP